MTTLHNKDGQVIGYSMDKITKPQRRRKERALFRLLHEIEKEQKAFEKQTKDFPLHKGVPEKPAKLQRMEREAYDLRSKLGVCTEEQLEEFKERMINPS